MKQRKPLDLLQKWMVCQYWVRQKPALTRAGMVVLLRLLDRQNTKTGRCDPSAIGLIEETGFSERSIRGAFKELEERGALKRFRAARRARNHFMIFSVTEIEQNQRLAQMKTRAGHRTDLQPVSARPAMRCRVGLQRTASETIKETIKKKGGAENVLAPGGEPSAESGNTSHCDIDLGEFERRVVKVFEKKGFGYEGLLALPAGHMEQAFEKYSDGAKSFVQAVGDLLAAYEAQQDRSI